MAPSHLTLRNLERSKFQVVHYGYIGWECHILWMSHKTICGRAAFSGVPAVFRLVIPSSVSLIGHVYLYIHQEGGKIPVTA